MTGMVVIPVVALVYLVMVALPVVLILIAAWILIASMALLYMGVMGSPGVSGEARIMIIICVFTFYILVYFGVVKPIMR